MRFNVIPVRAAATYARFRAWTQNGHAGRMRYLTDARARLRRDIRAVFPDTQSVLMAVFPYNPYDHAAPDYHDHVREHLAALLSEYQTRRPDLRGHIFVDTHPILERDYAAAAGLGQIGRNTCLIHPDYGPFVHIGGIALSQDLSAARTAGASRLPTVLSDARARASVCGNCRACIDACPTGALRAPYALDARACINYLVFEYRDVIDARFFAPLKNHFWGCHICQSACPTQTAARACIRSAPAPAPASPSQTPFDPAAWLALSPEAYARRVAGTAMRRVSFSMMQRNAIIQLVHAIGPASARAAARGGIRPALSDLARAQLEVMA